MRHETEKAFAANRNQLEYYDLGWSTACLLVLADFEALVKEEGFD